jgi:hypothetical protein
MCGPLALALPGDPRRWGAYAAGRLAYNAGRLLTYGLLGVVGGLVGRFLFLAGFQRWLSLGLGLAILAGWLGSRTLKLNTSVTSLVSWLKAGLAGLLRRRTIGSLGLLGGLNGLLPCGLVYVACAGAAATGGVWEGAAYMLCFGLGTVPLMLVISLSGKPLQGLLRLQLPRVIPVCLVLVSLLLILRGLSLGIPFLSPDLGGGSTCPACHAAPGSGSPEGGRE